MKLNAIVVSLVLASLLSAVAGFRCWFKHGPDTGTCETKGTQSCVVINYDQTYLNPEFKTRICAECPQEIARNVSAIKCGHYHDVVLEDRVLKASLCCCRGSYCNSAENIDKYVEAYRRPIPPPPSTQMPEKDQPTTTTPSISRCTTTEVSFFFLLIVSLFL